jgi:8-oxo-dGTP diphosphatase
MIDVTCAVIRNEDNEILVVQRGEKTDHPLKWEFPGGKLIPGESREECIIREIEEEVSMSIVICGSLEPVEYDYGHKQIRLIPFICDTLDDLPFLSEHLAHRWLAAEDLTSVDFCEADMVVAGNYLETISHGKQNITKVVQSVPDSVEQSVDDKDLQSMVNSIMGLKEAEWIATSAIENPAIFMKLVEFSFLPDEKLSFRASWILTKVCDRVQGMIDPYFPEIISKLNSLQNESTLRSFLRIISLSDMSGFTGKQHGILADHCFTALKSGFSAIAIKAYSMEILYKLAQLYPDLVSELSSSIRILLEESSAGVTSRGLQILKKLAEIPRT